MSKERFDRLLEKNVRLEKGIRTEAQKSDFKCLEREGRKV